MFSRIPSVSLFVFLALSACSLKVDSPQLKVDPSLNPKVTVGDVTTPPSCSASVGNATVAANQDVPVSVQASGGVGPYEVLGQAGSFASTTTVSRTYSNNSASNRILTDVVSILDADGKAAQCSFTVTVQPAGGGQQSNLACAIEVTPASPKIGDDVFVLISGSGGTAPYSFHSFSFDADGSVVQALSAVSATQTAGKIDFATSGLKTISIQVQDAQSNVVSCSKSLTVRSTPSLTLAASPSASVPQNQAITVVATAASFASSPTITFSTPASGVSVTASGNTALVSVTDGQAHSLTLTASATSGGESATASIPLSFTATSLPCHVTHSGSLSVGAPIVFTAVADNGEALQIQSFNAGTNSSVTASTAASRTVAFSNAGARTVLMTAKSLSSGALCNAGALLQDPVAITSSLSCSVATNTPGWTWVGQSFYVYPIVSGGSGTVSLDSLTLVDGGIQTNYSNVWGASGLYLAIQGAGTFQLQLNIHDSNGTTASCTASEVVYWW